MRLGVAGSIVPGDLDAVDDRAAARIAGLGLTGVGTHFLGDPETLPRAALVHARDVMSYHGVRTVQSWGWQEPLIHADTIRRQAVVRTLQYAVRVAADLGADMVMSGPGSLNPRGPWWPHPGNHTPQTEDILVASLLASFSSGLRPCCPTATAWSSTCLTAWCRRRLASCATSLASSASPYEHPEQEGNLVDLKDKIILITGGAQGIGEATARLCAARGARMVIVDVNREAGEKVAASIRQGGGTAQFEHVDVRNDAAVRALMAVVAERYSHLDAMICAAGVLKGAYQQPEELALDDFETVLDVNVKGTFLCAKYGTALLEAAAVSAAEPRRAGVMVLIASGAGVIVPSSSLAYGASKGGVNGLGMTLAARLAPRGIRVNVVCPGNIVTGMKLSVVAAEAERAGKSVEEALARAREEMGSPEGVARVLAFLVSEDADYVRGAIFTQ